MSLDPLFGDEALQAHVEAGDEVIAHLEEQGMTIDQAAAAIVGHWLADPGAWDLPAMVAAARRLHLATPADGRKRALLERSGLFRILRAAAHRDDYIAQAFGMGDVVAELQMLERA